MIIDMRVRPPFGSFMDDGILYDEASLKGTAELFKCEASKAALQKNISLFIQEMDEAGIDKVVAPVRIANGGKNESADELLKLYPEKIIGMAGINPLDDISKSLETIDQYVVHGNFTGINLEPGFSPAPYSIDGLLCNDNRIYPIYEKCEKEGKTVLLSFGGMCHWGLNKFNPNDLDQICADFPKLRIIISHGGFPYCAEVCWIAQRRGNLWISPDMYITHFGGSNFIDAARYFLQGKILFGSGYPGVSMKKAVETYQSLLIEPDIYEQVMGKAAMSALGL